MGRLIRDYEEDEVNAIIAFVEQMQTQKGTRSDPGVQYGAIRDHFKWGQDKWVKHWKRAQLFLVKKRPEKGGYPRYFVKQDSEEEAKALVFSEQIISQLTKGAVQEIEVPITSVVKAIDEEIERLRPMFEEMGRKEEKAAYEEKIRPAIELERETVLKRKKDIGSRLKEALGNRSTNSSQNGLIIMAKRMHFLKEVREHATKLHEQETRIALLSAARFSNIHIVYDKTESLPSIDGNDITHLLDILAKNVPARIKKPWYLVVEYSIPEDLFNPAEECTLDEDKGTST